MRDELCSSGGINIATIRDSLLLLLDRRFLYGYPDANLSENIAVSDDVYRKLKREKGKRSFRDVIEETLETGGRIADLTGPDVLDETVYKAVADDIERMSRETEARLIEEFVGENGR